MSKSSYPGQFDSDVELPRVDNNVTEIGGDAINSLRDAVFTIQRVLGLNPQGNTKDLTTRVNQSLDANGDIKSSALSKRGLVTVPITNNIIGENAGILESKLNLDYSTAFLNGRITSNVNEIDAIRTSFNGFTAQTVNHFSGLGNRHDGYMIDLVNPIRSSGDVETALNVVNNEFTGHVQSQTGAHRASGIAVNNEFRNFEADDVQEALVELDVLSTGTAQDHQDTLHQNGIGLNDRGQQGSQGNLAFTTLAPTIFQTEIAKATQILQVMRPNVARVTSKEVDFRALAVGQNSVLRVQAGGVDRGPLDIDFSALIPSPTTDVFLANEITLDQIVEAINTKAQGCVDHYPISAFNTNGRLTIAHNISGEQFTIQILNNVQFSADIALGFGSVTNTVFTWPGQAHAGYVGGAQINDLRALVKKSHVHSNNPLNVLPLGLGNLADFGLTIGNEGRVIVNITNHSTTPEDNGSHYITAFPNNQSIQLSADIQPGTFDIEIMADSVNFENTANGEIWDIFVEDDGDGYGKVTKSLRVSYQPIAGVTPISVTKDFPTSNIEWQITDENEIQFFENGEGGVPVTIPSASYRGKLQVNAADNKNSAIFEVHGIPSTGREDFNVSTFAATADRLYIGSVHHAGNFSPNQPQLKFVSDRRLQGAAIDNATADALNPVPLEKTISALRNNGIIDGFEVISSDQQSFRLRGGRALVEGRVVEVETQTLQVQNLSAARRIILLDKSGKYLMKTEFDPGFTFEDLTEGDSYGDNRGVVPIVEFETNGTQIDGYFTDRRLIVSKLDKKVLDLESSLVSRIDRVQETVAGSSWAFTEASASGLGDGYLASIEPGNNNGFTYIQTGQTGDTTNQHARGFTGGINPFISTRRFEFSEPDVIKTSVFKANGMTHINVFAEAVYTGVNGGPFGVSGTVGVELGVAVETGMGSTKVAEEYARVKTVLVGILPSDSVTERYVASIPVSQLNLTNNTFFDFVPRVRIINSTFVDGGSGNDPEPTIRFDNVRIVTSSYSIAGSISNTDGSSMPLAASVGDIL